MRTTMMLVTGASAALRSQGIVYPFPNLAGQDEAIMDAGAQPTQQAASTEDAAIAPWHAPTVKPDALLASTNTELFKHPTAEMVKDWETAPKVEMFDTPTMKPMEDMVPQKSEEPIAPPAEEVKSKIVPVDPYAKRDVDPELAAIQQQNPLAYGIVKALLMKKAMGLPMPGADAQSTANGKDEAQIPSSSGSISNMWNWKPQASPTDEMAEVEEVATVSREPAPEEEPKVEETAAPVAEQPAPVVAEEKPAQPVEASTDGTAQKLGASLGSWLGTSASVAPAPVQEAAPAVPQNALLSKYAMDLSF